MDGNTYQNSPSTGYPPYALDLSNDRSNEIMPPVAPSYKHSSWTAERSVYPGYDSEQQALNRLMDSVHKSRIEDVHIGKDTVQICLEDVHIVQGAIEIRARIIPKPDVHPEMKDHLDYLIPAHPQYQYQNQPLFQYSNQYPYQHPNHLLPQYSNQYPYQYPNQLPPQYSNQYPYQYPNQLPPQYSNQYSYQYPNQLPPQYSYLYQYPSQFPSRYLYQYPLANAAGSIAGAISQLVLTTNLLRR